MVDSGTRANTNGFDMNRDLLVQSQPEIKLNVAFQQEWLAPSDWRCMVTWIPPDRRLDQAA